MSGNLGDSHGLGSYPSPLGDASGLQLEISGYINIFIGRNSTLILRVSSPDSVWSIIERLGGFVEANAATAARLASAVEDLKSIVLRGGKERPLQVAAHPFFLQGIHGPFGSSGRISHGA